MFKSILTISSWTWTHLESRNAKKNRQQRSHGSPRKKKLISRLMSRGVYVVSCVRLGDLISPLRSSFSSFVSNICIN